QYSYPAFMAIIIGAGAFQLLLGALRLGAIANYFPSSVIKGMLAGIGIILISKQLPVALGYNHPDFWSKEFINLVNDTHLFTNVKELYTQLTAGAILITFFSLGIYIAYEKQWLKKIAFIPAPLLVVAGSILLQLVFTQFAPGLALTDAQLVKLPEHLFASFMLPDFAVFTTHTETIKLALVIGTLATLETLLCVEAIDKLDPWHRTTPGNRELVAQGIGNMLCGAVGALPLTAVIVRGSANIDAGGKTKLSSFTHGVFMLLAVLLIPFVINLIPLCALAAILIVTGYKLTRPKLFKSMFRLGWSQFLPFIITLVVILFTDLLIGVSVGLLLSIIFIIRNNYVADYDVQQSTHLGITNYTINLHTNVTFLDKAKIKQVLAHIPNYSRVVINGTLAQHIDHDVLEMISEYTETAKRKGIEIELIAVERVSVSDIH
ncbi:MAG TPA: SulP family inorganic anion transporter, partial [Chitinophagales bacterium]|nr:SulP family inorganic anion transporter [Chitinophagales bacterium]